VLAYHFHWAWAAIILGAVTGSIAYTYRKRRLELVPTLAVVSFIVPLFSNAGVMEGRFRKPLEGIFILALFWLAERVDWERRWLGLRSSKLQAPP